MENSDDLLKKENSKILNWLKNPYNFFIVGLFILIIIIRFYYFFITKNQPIWWDESQYMSEAKNIAGLVKYNLTGPRFPFYPLAMSMFFFLDIKNEIIMRFLALLIPSLLVIAMVYFCIRQMYNDKKIAAISTAIAAFLWENLFYSNRFQTENPSLLFQLIGIFIFFKCFVKKEDFLFIKSKYSLLWIILFSGLGVLLRPGTIMAMPALALFIIYLNKDKILTKKGIIVSIIFIALIIISLIYAPKIPYVKPFIDYFWHPENPIAWNTFTVFYGFYQSVISPIPAILFYCFLIGIILVIINMIIGYEKLKNLKVGKEELELKSDIFNLLTIISVLFIFLFLIRSPTFEYRWYFPLLIAMLAFTAYGIVKISEFVLSLIGIKDKKIILVLIIIITILGAYNQLVHSDQIIKYKITSYEQVKDAGLWLYQNSNKNDIIISASQPQITYYSERFTMDFYINGSLANESEFDKEINQYKPKYFLLDGFQQDFTPKWAYNWPLIHNDTVIPVMEYFFDQEQKQPAIVIYKINYNNQNIFK